MTQFEELLKLYKLYMEYIKSIDCGFHLQQPALVIFTIIH